MRIEVYKDWIIRSDERNVILCKSAGMRTKVNEKTGKETEQEVFKEETYHRDIESALNALCEKEIYASKATTLKGLQNCFTDLKTMLAGIGKELGV